MAIVGLIAYKAAKEYLLFTQTEDGSNGIPHHIADALQLLKDGHPQLIIAKLEIVIDGIILFTAEEIDAATGALTQQLLKEESQRRIQEIRKIIDLLNGQTYGAA